MVTFGDCAITDDTGALVGADGIKYEVLGEVNSSFNLLSSPRLSLNAQFIAVPPALRGARAGNASRELTNTTLSSIHLTACDGREGREGGSLRIEFDVSSGGLKCSLGNARGAADPRVPRLPTAAQVRDGAHQGPDYHPRAKPLPARH